MPEFHKQNPDRVWSYKPVLLSQYPAHDRVDSLRAKLDELKIDSAVFAEFRRTPQAIHWSSDFSDLVEYSELPNSEDILKKFNEYSFEVIRRCKERQSDNFKEWFEKIFQNVSIFSNGVDYCIVWGLELEKKIDWNPAPPPVPMVSPVIIDPIDLVESTESPASPASPEPPGPLGPPLPPPPPAKSINWWLILLILLGLLFLFGFIWNLRNCPSCDQMNRGEVWSPSLGEVVVNPLPDRLPETPNFQPPFSENDIVEMPDQGGRVIAGRLNVAMMSDDHDFASFMLEVDDLLPSSDYELVYWDPQTRRIQVACEPDSMDVLKHLVKSSLDDYNVLTWPERIFSRSQNHLSDNFWNEPPEKNWHLKQIGADEIYNVVGDTSVRLAIVDDGFDLNHIDFSKNYSDAYNVTSGSKVVSSSFERQHGTHVAGIATANSDNNIGSLGLANKCTLLPIQIANDVNPENLSSTYIIDGILYALNKGADVINISLGLTITGFEEWTKQDSVNFKNAYYDESIFWRELYSKLEENNVIVVLAAGNDSVPLELDPMHNSTYPVFVCASGPYNELANFPIGGSNYPSQNNDSMTVVVAPGFIWSLVPHDNYEMWPGTSMSAPLVASVIALMKCEYPEISNEQIRSDLLSCPPVGESNIPLVWMPSLFNQNELDS
jgi:hypothetical protein